MLLYVFFNQRVAFITGKLLWGPTGEQSEYQCYEQNKKGTRHGNCGYDRISGSYMKCHDEDVRCGMLHCTHLNEQLEFGMESVAILSHSFINSGGRIIPCRTALVDLGLNQIDPGLAPEGAKCGDGSLCVNKKCMPVASLKIGPASCPENCNGHGTCNSNGHCHCGKNFCKRRRRSDTKFKMQSLRGCRFRVRSSSMLRIGSGRQRRLWPCNKPGQLNGSRGATCSRPYHRDTLGYPLYRSGHQERWA